jgi:hypothetical protein
MGLPEDAYPPEQAAQRIFAEDAEGLYNFLTANFATSYAVNQAEVILEAMEQVAKDRTMPALAQIDILSICRDALEVRMRERLLAHDFDIRHLEGWPEKPSIEHYEGNDEAVQTQLSALRGLIAVVKRMQDSVRVIKEDLS